MNNELVARDLNLTEINNKVYEIPNLKVLDLSRNQISTIENNKISLLAQSLKNIRLA